MFQRHNCLYREKSGEGEEGRVVRRLDVRCGPKLCQINPKWDKSGSFSDQILVYFGSPRENVLESDLKKFRICPIWAQSEPLLA